MNRNILLCFHSILHTMDSIMESEFVADDLLLMLILVFILTLLMICCCRTSILTFKQDEDETDNNMVLPPALTASDKESFAYPSLKDRLPIIICKVMISFSKIYISVLFLAWHIK